MKDEDVSEIIGWGVAMFLAFMLVLVATHPPTASPQLPSDQQELEQNPL